METLPQCTKRLPELPLNSTRQQQKQEFDGKITEPNNDIDLNPLTSTSISDVFNINNSKDNDGQSLIGSVPCNQDMEICSTYSFVSDRFQELNGHLHVNHNK